VISVGTEVAAAGQFGETAELRPTILKINVVGPTFVGANNNG